jgi:hypothetical protein
MSDSNADKTFGVRFQFDSGNPRPGNWVTEQTFGLTTEASARAFFDAAVQHRHMRDISLMRGDEVIDRHD